MSGFIPEASSSADASRAGGSASAAISKLSRCLLPIHMGMCEAELCGEPYTDSTVVLHFMGSGASDQVTAGEVRQALDAAETAMVSAGRLEAALRAALKDADWGLEEGDQYPPWVEQARAALTADGALEAPSTGADQASGSASS